MGVKATAIQMFTIIQINSVIHRFQKLIVNNLDSDYYSKPTFAVKHSSKHKLI